MQREMRKKVKHWIRKQEIGYYIAHNVYCDDKLYGETFQRITTFNASLLSLNFLNVRICKYTRTPYLCRKYRCFITFVSRKSLRLSQLFTFFLSFRSNRQDNFLLYENFSFDFVRGLLMKNNCPIIEHILGTWFESLQLFVRIWRLASHTYPSLPLQSVCSMIGQSMFFNNVSTKLKWKF